MKPMVKRAQLVWAIAMVCATPVWAADTCAYRGDLSPAYCDANRDLVADLPTDPQRLQDPSTLVFSYAPGADSVVYEKLLRPFIDYLTSCVGRPVSYLPVSSNVAEVEAMRTGRLHVAGFSTGTTVVAVRAAGAVPFAEKGSVDHAQNLHALVIVRKDRSYRKLSDLKGKAHCGNVAIGSLGAPDRFSQGRPGTRHRLRHRVFG